MNHNSNLDLSESNSSKTQMFALNSIYFESKSPFQASFLNEETKFDLSYEFPEEQRKINQISSIKIKKLGRCKKQGKKEKKRVLKVNVTPSAIEEIIKFTINGFTPPRLDLEKYDEIHFIQTDSGSISIANNKGEVRNVTRLLGTHIFRFVRNLAKKKEFSPKFDNLLRKVSKRMIVRPKDQCHYKNWRLDVVTYQKFKSWLEENHIEINSLKNFREIFGFNKICKENSYEFNHFYIVLRRIAKHVLLNEFTRHLIDNLQYKKYNQKWENAIKYIEVLPKFLKGLKDPQYLNSLTSE